MKTMLPILAAIAATLSSSAVYADEPQPPSHPAPPGSTIPGLSDLPLLGPLFTKGDFLFVQAPGKPGERAPDGPNHFQYQVQKPDGPRMLGESREPQPFLGVVTAPVPAALTAQLGLSEGFGLLVDEVLPESPAASAGLQKYDVLKTFNDQQLINPDQLATLVRAAGKDKEVTLTLLRKGQEQRVTAKVAERVLPARPQPDGPNWKPVPMPKLENWMYERKAGERNDRPKAEGELSVQEQRFRDLSEKVRHANEEAQARAKKELEHAASAMKEGIAPSAILREAAPDGGGQLKVIKKDGVTTIDGAKARFMLNDANGEMEVVVENGHRMLTAKNAKGDIVFNGAVDTEEQRKALPQELQKRLDQIKIIEKREANGKGNSISIEGHAEAIDETRVQ